ncbi:restriction endonuclease subunit S [Providencia rustigianii]|uniref:restriction endonuclease subunit S n=1 Tax=Providencia rustigianii TaxID=158850 RepID=UPI002240CD87|nr:restriction endonuclease subunit S [Providencia rustigianii]
MVPNGWEKHPIGNICRSIVPGRNKPKVFNGDIPWVTTPEIDGKYIPSSKQVNYISNHVAKECGAKLVPEGAVVIAAVGDLGLTAIASEKLFLNQQLHAFVCPESVHNEYIAYFLSSQKPYMYTVASKTTIPYMNKSNCESIPILLPPLPEQQKIAKILSTWDKAIATTEKLIATSQQQKKALMQQLLTGKKRLVDPDTGKVFEGEWELTHLKSLLIEEKSRNKDNKITRVLSVTNHSGFVLPEDQFSKRVASENISNYKIVKQGQFGYNPSRLNVGSFACLNQFSEGVLSPMYVVFSTNDSKLQRDYLSYWMDSHEAKQRIKNSTQGSVRESVGFDALCSFPFILPALNEQQKIASVLTAADKEIELLQAKLAHLKDEKKALMQQLLTGKRRVKVDENVAA